MTFETIILFAIVIAAAGYAGYRLISKKGCGCGCGGSGISSCCSSSGTKGACCSTKPK